MIKKFFIIAGLTAFAGLSAQKTHTVVKGDNPYNIAKRYGMTVDDLVKLNPNSKDGKVAIGDILLSTNQEVLLLQLNQKRRHLLLN